jgi:mono/diheme cytochrome c family protein
MAVLQAGIVAEVRLDLNSRRVSPRTWYALVFIFVVAVYSGVRQWDPAPQFSNNPAFGNAGAQTSGEDSSGELGAKIYHEKCAGCHGNKGEGVHSLFPPLAGDPVVTATDPGDHIRAVLFGRHGAIIGGVTYMVYMPSWAGQLSDGEVAAVINHERTSWGNSAPMVTPAEVAKVRSAGH